MQPIIQTTDTISARQIKYLLSIDDQTLDNWTNHNWLEVKPVQQSIINADRQYSNISFRKLLMSDLIVDDVDFLVRFNIMIEQFKFDPKLSLAMLDVLSHELDFGTDFSDEIISGSRIWFQVLVLIALINNQNPYSKSVNISIELISMVAQRLSQNVKLVLKQPFYPKLVNYRSSIMTTTLPTLQQKLKYLQNLTTSKVVKSLWGQLLSLTLQNQFDVKFVEFEDVVLMCQLFRI